MAASPIINIIKTEMAQYTQQYTRGVVRAQRRLIQPLPVRTREIHARARTKDLFSVAYLYAPRRAFLYAHKRNNRRIGEKEYIVRANIPRASACKKAKRGRQWGKKEKKKEIRTNYYYYYLFVAAAIARTQSSEIHGARDRLICVAAVTVSRRCPSVMHWQRLPHRRMWKTLAARRPKQKKKKRRGDRAARRGSDYLYRCAHTHTHL